MQEILGEVAVHVATTGGSAMQDTGGSVSVGHHHWRQLEAAMQEMLEEGPVHVAITEGSAELQCKTLENLTLQISTTAGSAVRDAGGSTSAARHHWR